MYLDATGSRDPDGEVDDYRWRIELPDGTYGTPSCERCGRTTFVPRATGTYNATVTVTDGDGATSTDTLRVHVEASNGPSVMLSGPESVTEGRVAEYSATLAAGANDLAGALWEVDDRRVNRTVLTGESATSEQTVGFRRAGQFTVRVTVVDRLGRERTATKNVTVTEPATSGVGSGGDDGSECSHFNRDDDRYCHHDSMTIDNQGIVISDADNDDTTEWAGVTLDEEFAQNHEGVSYDSIDDVATFESKEAYKEALGVDSANVDPDSDVNSRTTDATNGQTNNNSFSQNSSDDGSEQNEEKSDESNEMPDRVSDRIDRMRGSNSLERDSNRGDYTTERTGRVPLRKDNGGPRF
ncbi:PKD domain-containing protein [Halosimplex litoreum]|uniref:PKD domain-containing protein n=1 Tax=Halosimplex litoreum TaxID=1198301 RepID=A0A7T3FX55_9EURY|nr:PKD domain-containing protein [Halosimplex litoreum]QPV62266.1 PKD domain-containing protein [Halosimplex litoreum]